jgi:hypothetical protein
MSPIISLAFKGLTTCKRWRRGAALLPNDVRLEGRLLVSQITRSDDTYDSTSHLKIRSLSPQVGDHDVHLSEHPS